MTAKKKLVTKNAPAPKKIKQRKQTESRRDRGMSSDRPTAKGRGQADWT